MRYFQRKMIGFAAVMAFTVVYASLRQFPFGVDAAICASFTVLVFGNALRRRGLELFTGDEKKPLTEILLIHALALAALVIIVRMGMYITPFLPDWMSTPIGADNQGRIGPNGFQILQSLALFGLGFFEFRLLAAKPSAAEGEEQATISPWGNADLEAERMSGLRLR
ncbi:MAG: hypothetical protein WA891_17010 [Acidobacteriaceae bacterium]|jgi:hypothetical protein